MGLFTTKKKPVKQDRPYQEEDRDSYEVENENEEEEY